MKDIQFGLRLKKLRKLKDFRQTKAAQLIGISYSSLQGHEGGSLPNRRNIQKYASFYGCDENWLVSGQGDPLYKEGEGEPGSTVLAVESPTPTYNKVEGEPSDSIGLGQAVELLAKVFSSDNKRLIRAITANLDAFSEVVESKEREGQAVQMMSKMSDRMAALEERLKRDVAELKAENAELKKRLEEVDHSG